MARVPVLNSFNPVAAWGSKLQWEDDKSTSSLMAATGKETGLSVTDVMANYCFDIFGINKFDFENFLGKSQKANRLNANIKSIIFPFPQYKKDEIGHFTANVLEVKELNMSAQKTIINLTVAILFLYISFQVNGSKPAAVVFAKIKKTLGLNLPPLGHLSIDTVPFDHVLGECKLNGQFDNAQMLGLANSELELNSLTATSSEFTVKTPKIEFKGNYTLKLEKCTEKFDGTTSGGFDFSLFNLTVKFSLNISETTPKQIVDLHLDWTVGDMSLNADNLFVDKETGSTMVAAINSYGTTYLNSLPPESKAKFEEKIVISLF
uniref:Uncharacterized protein n=1 Tax=Strigamia maritima TaxID=126957 RepID=T1J1Z6_STRMM